MKSFPCAVCGNDIEWDAPSGVCSQNCIERGQGFHNDTEPEEGDYTTEDHLRWYQYGKLVLDLNEDDDCNDEVLKHMDREHFYPNAWFISDHGNTHLIDLSK